MTNPRKHPAPDYTDLVPLLSKIIYLTEDELTQVQLRLELHVQQHVNRQRLDIDYVAMSKQYGEPLRVLLTTPQCNAMGTLLVLRSLIGKFESWRIFRLHLSEFIDLGYLD